MEFGIAIPDLMLQPASFCSQLCFQLYRNVLPIYRNITLFILELIGSLICSYMLTIFYVDIFYERISHHFGPIILIIYGFSILFGFILYLGGIIYDKIKERKTKTKCLLYLSGCSMWSYWCGFLVIDSLKLILFFILSLLPIYFYPNLLIHYFLSIPMLCLSSLVYIYFLSLFWRDEDSGTKILSTSILISCILIAILYFFIFLITSDKHAFINDISGKIFQKRFTFTLFDITPLTSISLTFCRITYSYNSHKYKDDDEIAYYYKPYWYVISGCLNQFINFIVYSILLYLNEIGLFNRCFIKIKSSNSEFDFSEESVAEDFYAF